MLVISKDSHLDHGVTPAHVEWLNYYFSHKDSFFIATVELPAHLEDLTSGLYGPMEGDLPVEEEEVHYAIRGQRKCATRTVKRPKRRTRFVTVVAGPHEDRPCVLYTAYGGHEAPREPGDLTLKTWEEVLESRSFWKVHALAE